MSPSVSTTIPWLAVLAGACAACAPGAPAPLGDGARALSRPAAFAPAAVDSLLDFVAAGAVGSATELPATAAGPALRVQIEADYHAASGKACRRLSLAETGAPAAARTACRDAVGVWRLLPRLLNHDLGALERLAPGAS